MGPDFPCLADEIAEPRPGMNIKVTEFTVCAKSSIIYVDSLEFKIQIFYSPYMILARSFDACFGLVYASSLQSR